MSNDRYERIRAALAMGPTPESWAHDIDEDAAYAMFCVQSAAEAAFILACDPDTIRELLAERDQLVSALAHRAHPAITFCDNCGCDWLDNGLNPVSCPYCTIRELMEERDELAKDAARYRWLRDPCSGAEQVIFYGRGDYGRGLKSGSWLDAAIDESMEKEVSND